VGLGIGAESVRVVLVTRAGVVRWHREVARASADLPSLERALREALAAMPGRRWPHLRAVAALGPHCTQVRLVSELPPLGNPRAMARVVAESPHWFFLRNGAPVTTGGVRLVDERSAWAAAFERPVVETIAHACREARMRLDAVVPTAAVLHAGLADQAVSWIDGGVRCDIVYEGHVLHSVIRTPSTAAVGDASSAHVPGDRLAGIGRDAWRYADALGAVTAGPREPLRLGAKALTGPPAQGVSSWRGAATYLAAITALLLVAVTPGLRAWRTEVLAEREVRARASGRHGVAVTAQQLERVTRALAEGADFARHRRSHLSLLTSLTKAFPTNAWVMALRTDSTGGHLVSLSGGAAGVLAAMDSVEGITGAVLLGPVTNEVAGAREVERATIRFRWSGAICTAPPESCGNAGETR
jgi:hypothetical protein